MIEKLGSSRFDIFRGQIVSVRTKSWLGVLKVQTGDMGNTLDREHG
jgi:hypothetical protein